MNLIKMKKLIFDINNLLNLTTKDTEMKDKEKIEIIDKIIDISFYNIDTINNAKDSNYKWYKKAFNNMYKFCIIGLASNLFLGAVGVFEASSTLFSCIAFSITFIIPEIILSITQKIELNAHNENIKKLDNIIKNSLAEKTKLEIRIIDNQIKKQANKKEPSYTFEYNPNSSIVNNKSGSCKASSKIRELKK